MWRKLHQGTSQSKLLKQMKKSFQSAMQRKCITVNKYNDNSKFLIGYTGSQEKVVQNL